MSAKKIFQSTAKFFGSFGLSCIILFLLLVLVYFGTVEQVTRGLYEVQKKYFESLFLVHDLQIFDATLPIPLPGAYLLLILLFVNLIVGGIVRMRKSWARVGILIAHVGIASMLLGGYLTLQYSVDGHVTLYENESASVFRSYHQWEIAVIQPGANGKGQEYLIPDTELMGQGPVRFTHAALPFDVEVRAYERNSEPGMVAPGSAAARSAVDGFILKALDLAREHEQNTAGAYVALYDKKSGDVVESILWGGQRVPWSTEVGGQSWMLDVRKRRYELPFTVVLDKFTRELHPRTGMAKVFMSDVTKIENGVSQSLKITMNEPLREQGFTLYQSSWGPSNARPGDPLYSTLAVVNNPADQLPLYACIIISLGLLIHFSRGLVRYLKAEAKKQS